MASTSLVSTICETRREQIKMPSVATQSISSDAAITPACGVEAAVHEAAGVRLLFDKNGAAAGILRQDADPDLSGEASG
jgi:hypothetical protein